MSMEHECLREERRIDAAVYPAPNAICNTEGNALQSQNKIGKDGCSGERRPSWTPWKAGHLLNHFASVSDGIRVKLKVSHVKGVLV